MKLSDFEMDLDPVILDRGETYFIEGHIEDITEIDCYHYAVEVIGSDFYTVYIYLDEQDEITNTYCDCPYDLGPYCKHQAAALFALREKRNKRKHKQKQKNNNRKKADLKSILTKCKKAELVDIILTLSKEYPEIEKELLFKYTAPEDELSASRALIKEYINAAKGRGGFIEYRNVNQALYGADLTLEKASNNIKVGETENAVLLSIVVLSIVVEMLQFCDDSNGEVGQVINESINIIHDAVDGDLEILSDREQEQIFEAILNEALHSRYDGWSDLRFDLLHTLLLFAENERFRVELEKQFNMLLENVDEDSWSAKYEKDRIKELQLELIEYNESEEKAAEFIQNNIESYTFREKAVLRLLEKESYQEVIRLCEEGEEVDNNYPGIVRMWKTYKLQAYEELGDIEKQRELMLEFLTENDFTYYSKLKELYEPNEWQTVLQKILHKLESEKYIPSAYIEILKEEKLTDKLLEYCKQQTSSIVEFYPYLIEDYPEEVNHLFKSFIETAAAHASSRSQYRNVCRHIKTYKKACGNSYDEKLIGELQQRYKRRPAFLDELGKMN
jgi:hypothetical protein